MTREKIKTRDCRHGRLSYYGVDEVVGKSLDVYGEYSEYEVDVFRKILRPGDVALDVGANIGAFTVAMSKLVGDSGEVHAFEPGEANFELLLRNIEDNHCDNVEAWQLAASDKYGDLPFVDHDQLVAQATHNYGISQVDSSGSGFASKTVQCVTIDSLLRLQRLRFAKLDVEGHEAFVLRGMRETISRCKPLLYVEADRLEKQTELIALLVDYGYRCFWHRPMLYRADNFAGVKKNVFGNIVSIMLICVPESMGMTIAGCEEVADLRPDADMFNREIARHARFVQQAVDHTSKIDAAEQVQSRLRQAHYCQLMQRSEEAATLIEENLRQDPQHVSSLAVKGLHALQRGDWHNGWSGYELRHRQPSKGYFGADRTWKVPRWAGDPLDAPVYISCEQGYGDHFMFVRFMKEVLRRAPNAYLECVPETYELFEQSQLVPPGKLIRMHRTPPEGIVAYCPLPSLPALFDVGEEEIRVDGPYLHAEPRLVEHWRSRKEPRIGTCCGGSFRSERPYTRDLPEHLLTPIAHKYGPFLSLQQQGQFADWMDTAAAVSALDLVITVDTGIAHLAGALGKEAWLLLSFDPDWRWGLHGSECIWYESMRLFRQPKFRDWESVMQEVEAALDERFADEQETKAA